MFEALRKKSGLDLTEEQKTIRDVITGCPEKHVIVYALAGTGKTTQMVLSLEAMRMRIIVGKLNAGIMAFNKSVSKELKRKVPKGVYAGTAHGLAYKIIRENWGSVDVDPDKTWDLIGELKGRHGIRTWRRGQRPAVKQLVSLLKQQGFDPRKPETGLMGELCERHGIYWPGGETETLYDFAMDVLSEGLKRKDTVDFDDQIWFPYVEGLRMKPFNLLMVDEAQDLNRVQQYIAMENAQRLVVVGDPNQCQPAETQVTLTGGEEKSIHDVKIGDELVSYSRDSGCFTGRTSQGRKIISKSQREFCGEMITVHACDKSTSCTPNHKWVARFTERSTGTCVVYLMKKGNKYRVGWCQLFDSQGCLHLGTRTRLEKADCSWILSVHEDRTEASMEESFVATLYGLPVITFREIPGCKHFTREAIDTLFSRFDEGDMEVRADACLRDHHCYIEYPFYKSKTRKGRTTIFEVEACNLIPGLMSVPLYEGNRYAVWEPVRITRDMRKCLVYSLEVESNQTYVADGITTHNSLYGFRGADPKSMDTFHERLAERGPVAHLPLTVCWRCSEAVISLAQKIVPSIKARPGAPPGNWCIEDRYNSYEKWNEGDMVVCRTNAPLIKRMYQLIRDKRRGFIQGRDVAAGLKRVIDRFEDETEGGYDLVEFSRWLDHYEGKEQERIEREGGSGSRMSALQDKCDCMRTMVRNFSPLRTATVKNLREDLEVLFKDNGDLRTNVRLSSVHRAKGLEADRVFILEPDLMPHRMAEREWELKQEANAAYVAVTRARESVEFVGGLSSYFDENP